MTHDVPFLRHVTSNKTYYVCMFSKFVNVITIGLKIGTHIDWPYNMYIAKTYINKAIRDVKYLAPPHASAWQRSPHSNFIFLIDRVTQEVHTKNI